MPITHDTYLSATLARLWGVGANAGGRKLSAWDRPHHKPPSHRATPVPTGIAQPGQPAAPGWGGRQPKPLWKSCE
jgi:hypothetical protein